MDIIYVRTNRIEGQYRSLWFDAFVKMIEIERNQNSDISYTYIYIQYVYIENNLGWRNSVFVSVQ